MYEGFNICEWKLSRNINNEPAACENALSQNTTFRMKRVIIIFKILNLLISIIKIIFFAFWLQIYKKTDLINVLKLA